MQVYTKNESRCEIKLQDAFEQLKLRQNMFAFTISHLDYTHYSTTANTTHVQHSETGSGKKERKLISIFVHLFYFLEITVKCDK